MSVIKCVKKKVHVLANESCRQSGKNANTQRVSKTRRLLSEGTGLATVDIRVYRIRYDSKKHAVAGTS